MVILTSRDRQSKFIIYSKPNHYIHIENHTKNNTDVQGTVKLPKMQEVSDQITQFNTGSSTTLNQFLDIKPCQNPKEMEALINYLK